MALEPQTYFIVPPWRVKNFIGREDQLKEFSSYFSATDSPDNRILFVSATSGQGKTQIALEYCRRSRERYRGIFWINCGSEALLIRSYNQIAAALTGSSPSLADETRATVEAVGRELEAWNERWLLVLDNYGAEALTLPDLNPLIPSGGRCDILLTTRHPGPFEPGPTLVTPPMPLKDGVSLLLQAYDDHDIQKHMVAGTEIVTRLDGLAFAIDQAAGYLSHKRLPLDRLDEFLITYEAQQKELSTYDLNDFWPEKMWQTQAWGQDKAISAFTTLEISFRQTQTDGAWNRDHVAHFLTLSAFFDSASISESLFRGHWEAENETRPVWMDLFIEAGRSKTTDGEPSAEHNSSGHRDSDAGQPNVWSPEQFRDVITKLHERSLLQSISPESSQADASFSMHPLTRDWLQLRQTAQERQRYTQEALDVVVNCIKACNSSTDAVSAEERKARLVPHVDRCLANDARFSEPENALGQDISNCDAAGEIAIFYQMLGNKQSYAVSERLWRLIVATRTAMQGQEHPSTLNSMDELALVLENQSKYPEAEDLYRQTLELKTTALGAQHSSTLWSMRNLAALLSLKAKKYGAAEDAYRRLLELDRTVLGREHPTTLRTMNSLACTLHNQAKYAEAEEVYRATLELRQKALGPLHPETAQSLGNLSVVLDSQEKYAEAEVVWWQVLRLEKEQQRVRGIEAKEKEKDQQQQQNQTWAVRSLKAGADSHGQRGDHERVEKIHQSIAAVSEMMESSKMQSAEAPAKKLSSKGRSGGTGTVVSDLSNSLSWAETRRSEVSGDNASRFNGE